MNVSNLHKLFLCSSVIQCPAFNLRGCCYQSTAWFHNFVWISTFVFLMKWRCPFIHHKWKIGWKFLFLLILTRKEWTLCRFIWILLNLYDESLTINIHVLFKSYFTLYCYWIEIKINIFLYLLYCLLPKLSLWEWSFAVLWQ